MGRIDTSEVAGLLSAVHQGWRVKCGVCPVGSWHATHAVRERQKGGYETVQWLCPEHMNDYVQFAQRQKHAVTIERLPNSPLSNFFEGFAGESTE